MIIRTSGKKVMGKNIGNGHHYNITVLRRSLQGGLGSLGYHNQFFTITKA